MPEVVATYTSHRAAQEHAASLNLTRLANELFVVRTIGDPRVRGQAHVGSDQCRRKIMSKEDDALTVARLCFALQVINDPWLDRVAYWILRGLDKRAAENMADFETRKQEDTDGNR